jgi:hypothetical protein
MAYGMIPITANLTSSKLKNNHRKFPIWDPGFHAWKNLPFVKYPSYCININVLMKFLKKKHVGFI